MATSVRAVAGRRIVVALAVWLAAASGTAEAQPVTIKIGWAQTPGHLAPLIAELAKRHPELFHHLGKSYVSVPVRFQGSTPQIQALATGDLQIAAFGSAATALAITRAHLDVRVVGDVVQDGVEGYFTQPYYVRTDGPIKTVTDVKGKRIATNAIGSGSDAAMRILFHRDGIQDGDFTTIEANFANMPALLEDGKVDLVPILPQFARSIESNAKYRALFHMHDVYGQSQVVEWAMSADFIKKHRPALVDFFADHIRAVRWFLDPAHHQEAVEIAHDVTKQPIENLDYAFTKKDQYRSPDAKPNVPAIQREIDDSVKLGILPMDVKLAPKYVDLTLIADAKRRIDGN
jgi:NitT/TauT family transport system substrate-binding protein